MKKLPLSICLAAALTTGVPFAVGQTSSEQATSATAAPDNSRENKLDSNRTVTADSQKENVSDRQVIKSIRKSVIADKSLSTYAHNVKIVSVNGQVTLNGVVKSDEEKAIVEQKALAVAGTGHITNDLKVAAK